MSDKLQQKLDQETLSPIFAVFLRLLLVMAGFLEDFGDSELKIEEIKVNPEDMKYPGLDSMTAMDRAVGTDLSVAIRDAMIVGEQARTTLGERFFDDMLGQRRAHLERMVAEREARGEARWGISNHSDCHSAPIDMQAALNIPDGFRNSAPLPTISAYNPRRPNDLRRFEEVPIHEQVDEVHIDLGALGAVAIPVPEGAQSLEVDPRTFTIQWTMQDGSVQPMCDLRDYMTSRPRWQLGSFSNWNQADGYCTPSRHPITGRDCNGRLRQFRDIGHFTFSDGSPVSYGIDRNGRAVMLEQGGERGEGPCLDRAN